MRLISEIWAKAYINVVQINNAFAYVVKRGEKNSGQILIKIISPDKIRLLIPAPMNYESNFDRKWIEKMCVDKTKYKEIEVELEKQSQFDSDLWIIDVESKDGRDFLEIL